MQSNILLKKIISSNIDSIGYDNSMNILLVEFKTGVLYQYENISSELYESLLNAKSIGKFFASNIKGKYPYKEVKINVEQ